MSRRATASIRGNELLVSPIVGLELQYLYEIGRISEPPGVILENQRAQFGVRVCDLALDRVVASSIEQSWTRDAFDRLIVGHAVAAQRPLVTADRRILEHYTDAVW